MPKHIREALRRAGIPCGAATLRFKGRHYRLTVGGRSITCSTSPKDCDTAARQIAKDLKKKAQGAHASWA